MRRRIHIAVTLLPLLVGAIVQTGCDCGCPVPIKQAREARLVVPEISPVEAWRQLQANDDVFLVDVRLKEEYDRASIPGSVLIPRETIEFAIFKNTLFPEINRGRVPRKDQTIFLYCRTGGRSLLAGKTLRDLGFSNVRSIRGGILQWQREGLPTNRQAGPSPDQAARNKDRTERSP